MIECNNSSVGDITGLNFRKNTELIVLHHSATTRSQKCDVHLIHRWHISRGWSGIGYHFVIEKDGTLRVGRPLNTVGAHVRGYNSVSVGICMVGGIDKEGDVVDNFSDSQYKTLQSLKITLENVFPDAKFCKHKDLADTKCNGVDLSKIEERI